MSKKEIYLLFLGWGSIKRSYSKFIKTAPENIEVIAISYHKLMEDSDIGKFNKKLLKHLKLLEGDKVNLVGHSMGGALALQFSYHYPKKVKRLYLMNCEGIYGRENFVKMLVMWVIANANFFSKRIDLLILSILDILKRPIWSLKMARYAHFVHLEQEAKKLTVPTTIIWGEKDKVVPLRQGQKLHQLIKDSKLITLPNKGHDWILHSPELFWKNI